MENKINVLDHGHILFLDKMGNDSAIIQAARTSYQNETRHVSDDRTLIRYLLNHEHMSPFESVVIKFHIKLPIFVERQWARHRTAGWNEVSARYSVLPNETYTPLPEKIQAQSKSNKQGRSGNLSEKIKQKFLSNLQESNSLAFNNYQDSLDDDISRELARIGLPLSTYTEKVWWCNLRNIFNFLHLRMDSHAQEEIRLYANAMYEIVKQVCPVACEAFEDYVLNARKFSAMEIKVLRDMLSVIEEEYKQGYKPYNMTDREWKAFLEKLV